MYIVMDKHGVLLNLNLVNSMFKNITVTVTEGKYEEKNKVNRIDTFCSTFDGCFYRMFL